MYTAGFIQDRNKRVLINPIGFETVERLYEWLLKFLNPDDFLCEPLVSVNLLCNALATENVPLLIRFNGYGVYLIFGLTGVVMKAIDRTFVTDLFDLTNI